jgi:serine/threonine-protein kinase
MLEMQQYETACPKLEQSQKLDPAVGTMLYLAFCYEMTGRPGLAWRMYRAAHAAAAAQGQQARMKIAQLRAALLEPKLTRVQIPSDCLPTNAKVTIDGLEFDRDDVAKGLFLEAGRHTLLLGGWMPNVYEQSFETRLGEPMVVPIDCERASLVARSDAQSGHMARASVQPPLTVPAGPATARADAEKRADLRRWFGIASGAVGVVSLGIGVAYALDSAAKSDDAERYRRPGTNIYDEPGYSLNRDALESRTIAIVGFAISGAAIGGATVLLWPRRTASRSARGSSEGIRLTLSAQSFMLAAPWY